MLETHKTRVWSLGQGDPLEEEMAIAWEIPWTEEPGSLQSMGSQRAGLDWAHTHTHIMYNWEMLPLINTLITYIATICSYLVKTLKIWPFHYLCISLTSFPDYKFSVLLKSLSNVSNVFYSSHLGRKGTLHYNVKCIKKSSYVLTFKFKIQSGLRA